MSKFFIGLLLITLTSCGSGSFYEPKPKEYADKITKNTSSVATLNLVHNELAAMQFNSGQISLLNLQLKGLTPEANRAPFGMPVFMALKNWIYEVYKRYGYVNNDPGYSESEIRKYGQYSRTHLSQSSSEYTDIDNNLVKVLVANIPEVANIYNLIVQSTEKCRSILESDTILKDKLQECLVKNKNEKQVMAAKKKFDKRLNGILVTSTKDLKRLRKVMNDEIKKANNQIRVR